MADYDATLEELYQAPHGSFVAERKRLAADLKASGDKDGAARLAKRARPSISAWVVNQLWWHARDAVTTLLGSASRLRDGDLTAARDHRDAIAKLRTRAAAMLADAGHPANESTLRRVTQTLSAIAATGSWEPDSAGTLTTDRDPPGFDAAMLAPTIAGDGAEAAQRVVALTEQSRRTAAAVAKEAVAMRAKLEAPEEAVAIRPKLEEAPERPEARVIPIRKLPTETPLGPDRKELEAELRAARAGLSAKEAAVEELRAQLAQAKEAIAAARAVVDDLQAQLDAE
ncbi:hypothetical protein BH11MYX3_BH11MYX3_32040 [soil metagenome]